MEISKFLLQSATKPKLKITKLNKSTNDHQILSTTNTPSSHLLLFCCSARGVVLNLTLASALHRLDLIHHFNYYLKIITTNLPPYIIKSNSPTIYSFASVSLRKSAQLIQPSVSSANIITTFSNQTN